MIIIVERDEDSEGFRYHRKEQAPAGTLPYYQWELEASSKRDKSRNTRFHIYAREDFSREERKHINREIASQFCQPTGEA